jgi:[acyl-carrier-protein] S-malonyltransferase
MGGNGLMRAFIFPGQGSQAVGMGQALAEAFPVARAVFDEVDSTLSEKLTTTMWEGPANTLNLTANAQPALMAVSLAAFRVLESEAGLDLARDAGFVAGHSLGEYSALAAAGCLSIADAARLLRIRGRALPHRHDYAAVAGVAAEAAEGEICDVANDNGAGQVVVSGHAAAVGRAVAIAQGRGARRAVMLPVSAPFHCALMAPAAEVMREALSGVAIGAPAVPVFANVEAGPISDPIAIRDALVRQVTATVRWRESVDAMAGAGVDTFVEVGVGKVLCGLVKRIAPRATCAAFGGPGDLASVRAMWGN